MIRERGMFSNRYLTRRGKENAHHGNEEEFPLAYTSNKCSSKERPSLTQTKKVQEDHNKTQQLKVDTAKLEKELKEARQQIKKLKNDQQLKQSRHEHLLADLHRQLQDKGQALESAEGALKREEKRVKQLQLCVLRYRQTIKEQIYWLLHLFVNVQSGTIAGTQIKQEIENNYKSFHQYIQELGIQKELQTLISTSSIPLNGSNLTRIDSVLQQSRPNHDSIFTEDLEDNNVVKLMQLHPLIETFNNQHYEAGDSKIAKKLFDDSKDSLLFEPAKQSGSPSSIKANRTYHPSQSISDDNEFLHQQVDLPKDVQICKDFHPSGEEENYISLKKGHTLKLLRRIRDRLWIGQYQEKLGLVSQDYFQL